MPEVVRNYHLLVISWRAHNMQKSFGIICHAPCVASTVELKIIPVNRHQSPVSRGWVIWKAGLLFNRDIIEPFSIRVVVNIIQRFLTVFKCRYYKLLVSLLTLQEHLNVYKIALPLLMIKLGQHVGALFWPFETDACKISAILSQSACVNPSLNTKRNMPSCQVLCSVATRWVCVVVLISHKISRDLKAA